MPPLHEHGACNAFCVPWFRLFVQQRRFSMIVDILIVVLLVLAIIWLAHRV
jgi:hypothetical protein